MMMLLHDSRVCSFLLLCRVQSSSNKIRLIISKYILPGHYHHHHTHQCYNKSRVETDLMLFIFFIPNYRDLISIMQVQQTKSLLLIVSWFDQYFSEFFEPVDDYLSASLALSYKLLKLIRSTSLTCQSQIDDNILFLMFGLF